MGRGVGVTEAIRSDVPEWIVELAMVLTVLGDWLLVVPVLALLYIADVVSTIRGDGVDMEQPLCSDRTVFIIAAVFGGLALTLFLSGLFSLPRPPAALHAVTPSEYGFPSGHTMVATVFWGGLALWTTVGGSRIRAGGVAVVVAVVALSRLVLGVHFLVDVLAAIVFGLCYLVVLDRWFRDRPGAAFVIAGVFAVGAVLTTGGATRALLAVLGTAGAAVGWQLVESPPVRTRILTAFGSPEFSS